MLKNILQQKRCFKLVCGAGNEDATEVEKLVALYALAGANYFDLSAKEEIVNAAKRGLERVGITDVYLNVSIGIKGDPHVSKAVIKDTCVMCGECIYACQIQNAISINNLYPKVDSKKCIGCGKCITTCSRNAISMISNPLPIDKLLPSLLKKGISSIELHAVSNDTNDIFSKWDYISSLSNNIISLCIDRYLIGDKDLIERIKYMLIDRPPYSVIIQADGAPMSGCDNKPETTLQAIAIANIIQKANLPVFLMLSGGTNERTAELAKLFNIDFHGVALGSYARKIVKEYIDRDDFFSEEVFSKALVIAKKLVDTTLKYMG